MTTELSVDAPSKRTPHPNSLANLRPPWKPGESGNHVGERGPIVTPFMRRMADMTLEELMALEPKKLTLAELIAYRMLLKAATDEAWGDNTREQVLKRLDGDVVKGDVNVNIDARTQVLVRQVLSAGRKPE